MIIAPNWFRNCKIFSRADSISTTCRRKRALEKERSDVKTRQDQAQKVNHNCSNSNCYQLIYTESGADEMRCDERSLETQTVCFIIIFFYSLLFWYFSQFQRLKHAPIIASFLFRAFLVFTAISRHKNCFSFVNFKLVFSSTNEKVRRLKKKILFAYQLNVSIKLAGLDYFGIKTRYKLST